MKAVVLAFAALFSINASADLIMPPRQNAIDPSLSFFTCYVDEDQNGSVSEKEVYFTVDAERSELVDRRENVRYKIDSGVITKTPAGRPTGVRIGGRANGVAFAGGGSQTIDIETDFLARKRYNSVATIKVKTFYNSTSLPINLNCRL